MKIFRTILIAGLPVLIVVLGLLGVSVLNSGRKKGDSFVVDYHKLEALAASHPTGEKYLGFIKRDEGLLRDSDPSNDADAYLNIGFNTHVLGDEELAISAYKKALKIKPADFFGLNNIATSYRVLGNYKKAEEFYRELVRVNPGDTNVYRNLADVFRAQYPEDEEGIVRIMESGIEVVLEPGDLLSYLGVYFRDRGKIEEAIGYFENLTKRYPDNKPYKAELAELKEKL